MSRRERRHGAPSTAATVSINPPASRKRAVRSSSGGQSASASFATANAELHSRQKAAIMSGMAWDVARVEGGMARRMMLSVLPGDLCPALVIWKLNSTILIIRYSNGCLVLDLDLLRSFVSVVDAGGFTRAGERVHRTQSTVSQQIRRLEGDFGRPSLHRAGKRIRPTEEGERLLSYARRILALAEEARDVVSRPSGDGVVRLGLPEDFAAYRLTEMLSEFARSRPGLRLSVRCGKSDRMRRALERGEIDLALFKRDAEETGGIAAWPERLHWVTSRRRPVAFRRSVAARSIQ